MPRVSIIVARARHGVIGAGNTIPWRLPEDLKHFKATTLGHPVIMGRKTFESIGRPLPGRRTIVVTRNPQWAHPGCERAESLAAALLLCRGSEEVFVAGGAQIYEQALPLAQRLIITEIDLDVVGDTWFPALPAGQWQETARTPGVGASTALQYSIGEFRRRPGIGVLPPAGHTPTHGKLVD